MVIKVCVGSSCHLKGSYDVVEAFKALVKQYEVSDKVELQASFCLGNCLKGVSVVVEGVDGALVPESDRVKRSENGILLSCTNGENTAELFERVILPLLR